MARVQTGMSPQDMCRQVARSNGLDGGTAERCDSGSAGCSNCPWPHAWSAHWRGVHERRIASQSVSSNATYSGAPHVPPQVASASSAQGAQP